MDNNKGLFIKTSDEDVMKELLECGFTLMDKNNGIYTFLNNVNNYDLSNNTKIVYSDIMPI